MTDADYAPQDELNEFEMFLKKQPLGPTTEQAGELLYHCGYAAGLEAAQRKTQLSLRRWRVVGLAASAACMLFFLQLASTLLNDNDGLMAEAKAAIDAGEVIESGTDAPPSLKASVSEDRWIALLAQPRSAATHGHLRVSTSSQLTLDLPDVTPLTTSNRDQEQIRVEKILQPQDYRRLLQGEAS